MVIFHISVIYLFAFCTVEEIVVVSLDTMWKEVKLGSTAAHKALLLKGICS